MPLYDYACGACGRVTESLQRPEVAGLACPACGGLAARQLSRPVVRSELTPYYDHGLGQRIETRQQRIRLMRTHGLEEKGTTEMSGAKGTVFSHPGRASVSVPKSGAQLGPARR